MIVLKTPADMGHVRTSWIILHAHVTPAGKEKHVNKVSFVLVISSNIQKRASIRGPGTKAESLTTEVLEIEDARP